MFDKAYAEGYLPSVMGNPPTTAEKRTRELVREMTAAGLNPRQIARALELTTQAIYYHLNAIKAENGKGAA